MKRKKKTRSRNGTSSPLFLPCVYLFLSLDPRPELDRTLSLVKILGCLIFASSEQTASFRHSLHRAVTYASKHHADHLGPCASDIDFIVLGPALVCGEPPVGSDVWVPLILTRSSTSVSPSLHLCVSGCLIYYLTANGFLVSPFYPPSFFLSLSQLHTYASDCGTVR